jgi:hypothetical protein
MSHNILINILNPTFQNKTRYEAWGISINGDQILQLFVKKAMRGVENTLGTLIHLEILEWGPPNGEIVGGAHGERGREERNGERRRKKGHG